MEIITTHINADFDAVGSMIAARKLHPDAHLVFPGGQEKSLRDFFVQSTFHTLPVLRLRDIDLKKVTRLILVDCRQKGRIGKLAEIAGKNGVEVVIYDHHPKASDDILGNEEHIEQTGSTLAILCRILSEKKIHLEHDEATIMAMGIYEDTGSLTFKSTTVADYHAAAYLRSQGADLSLVAELMKRTLSREQVLLLGDLLRNITRHRIHDVEVGIVSVSLPDYKDDLAMLVNRILELENVDALFALFQAEDRIVFIARSRTDAIDTGAVARILGGGGHPTAASARLKEVTLAQAGEMLLDALHATCRPHRTASQMMTYPVKTVETSQCVAGAREIFMRYNLNSLLVVKEGLLVGMLSRQTIAKAEFHGLAGDEVEGYMTTDFTSVIPDEPFTEIYGIMISGSQAAVPVVKEGKPVGIITRTDFLRYLRTGPAPGPPESLPPEQAATRPELRKDVMQLLKSRLPEGALLRLKEIGKVAQDLGHNTYLVGGIVRDILLDNDNYDIDVVVEGDGIELALAFQKKNPCRIVPHERFGTAVIKFEDGAKIDVATARTEYYDRPASLPIVEASSLKLDLFRRDFTVNTLVVGINPANFGQLVDFFGAYRDLKEGVLRVLHNLSFIEDPTRILRAVRFEQRFGFQVGGPTMRILTKAVSLGVVERLSGPRLFNELQILLQEDNPLASISRLEELGVTQQIHPSLKMNKRNLTVLRQVQEVLSWWKLTMPPLKCQPWLVYLYGLLAFHRPEQAGEFYDRMGISEKLRQRLVQDKKDAEFILAKLARRSKFPHSFLHETLMGVSGEALLLALAKTRRASTRKAISAYLTQIIGTKTRISGRDLKKMGAMPGPLFKDILNKVLDARLDGKVHTKTEELHLAKNLLKKAGS